jgi:hypothetical protein
VILIARTLALHLAHAMIMVVSTLATSVADIEIVTERVMTAIMR